MRRRPKPPSGDGGFPPADSTPRQARDRRGDAAPAFILPPSRLYAAPRLPPLPARPSFGTVATEEPAMSVHGGHSTEAWVDADPSDSLPVTSAPALTPGLLEEEARFYGRYRWAVNAFPTVDELCRRLRDELHDWPTTPCDWRRHEVLTNIFLLSCALADSVDDYLTGDGYDFSQAAAVLPGIHRLVRAADTVIAAVRAVRAWRLGRLRGWREEWDAAIHAFAVASLAPDAGPGELGPPATRLSTLLDQPLPSGLLSRRIGVPAAFRSQDLALEDIRELALRFTDAFPDRARPVLVVGLRTAGSYFAPLVRAVLARRGYANVESLTMRPKSGLFRREQAALVRGAGRDALALVVDEPPKSGATLCRVVEALRRSGLTDDRIVVLVPVHPKCRDWNDGFEALPLRGTKLLTLEPEAWHKERGLAPARVEERLLAYFHARGYSTLLGGGEPRGRAIQPAARERLGREVPHAAEAGLRSVAPDRGRPRRVALRPGQERGLGLAGLSRVPGRGRARRVRAAGPRVCATASSTPSGCRSPRARARADAATATLGGLRRGARSGGWRSDTTRPETWTGDHHKGAELLASALEQRLRLEAGGGARARAAAARLARGALPAAHPHRRPDASPGVDPGTVLVLKTDFEHHGLGKTELNITDPAYDLAEAILHFRLSADEERRASRPVPGSRRRLRGGVTALPPQAAGGDRRDADRPPGPRRRPPAQPARGVPPGLRRGRRVPDRASRAARAGSPAGRRRRRAGARRSWSWTSTACSTSRSSGFRPRPPPGSKPSGSSTPMAWR